MCGRYALSASAEELATVFRLPLDEVHRVFDFGPRFNIAPSHPVAAVRRDRGDVGRKPVCLYWGLIPHWAKDGLIGARTINARAETLAEKPAFRDAFRERRCLVLADGFYEWRKLTSGRQPYLFRLADGSPFAFAGLWDRWEAPGRPAVDSCTIVTTQPNELTRLVHDRMPVILEPEGIERWLDPDADPGGLRGLLRPYAAERMQAHPVSTFVNRPEAEGRDCVEPIGPNLQPSRAEEAEQLGLF